MSSGRWWPRFGRLAVAVTLLGGACASSSGVQREDQDLPQIGLQRGGHWSVLSIKPPHLTGPNFHLILKGGTLTGAVSGGMAPPGTMNVQISRDGAQGHGPQGPVNMEFIEQQDAIIADGMWNGQRVHLEFRPASLHGTVAENSDELGRGDGDLRASSAELRRTRSLIGAGSTGADFVAPAHRNVSCEYFLDKRTNDGALTGGSTCSGMPQVTRLEVPAQAQDWFSRPELITVLVAMLSAPPLINAEAGRARVFDGSGDFDGSRR